MVIMDAAPIEGMIILSPTISSEELAACNIPIVGIEREDRKICSVSTDNYLGGVQAVSLLQKSCCDILIHVNSRVPETTPAFGRIRGFVDICKEHHLRYELILTDLGNTFKENHERIGDKGTDP